jgi:hypothetical protein
MSVAADRRFTRGLPCPVCKGFREARRKTGARCFGFLSVDGGFAHCTREEHAGELQQNTRTLAFSHTVSSVVASADGRMLDRGGSGREYSRGYPKLTIRVR